MKKQIFTSLVSSILICASILSLASCKSEKKPSPNKDNSKENTVDDGSSLANTRYEYSPGTYGSLSGTESLLGTISAGNGLLYYEFEEGAGATVLKSSLPAARNSTEMKATMTESGFSGRAVSFNGQNEYVKLNNSFSELSQITSSTFLHPAYSSLSVSFYIKPASSENCVIYEQGDSTKGLSVGIVGGHITAAVGAGKSENAKGSVTKIAGKKAVETGKWINIAVVFDGSQNGGSMFLYIDGQLEAYSEEIGAYIPQTLDAAGLATTKFGTNTLGITENVYYKGLMDELRIYSSSLSYRGVLEENAVYLQSGAHKNYYIKASSSPTVSTFVEPELRGFVLTYGLADKNGYSFRQTGTDNFLVIKDGSLTVAKADSNELKKGATFIKESPETIPSWGNSAKGAFCSFKTLDGSLYLCDSSGKLTLKDKESVSNKNALAFKVTGDQTKTVKNLKGAIYYPSYALNAPQFWKWYDSEIIDRDMGYATEILGVNAFRIWVSYEYWLEDPAHFEAGFKDFLNLAEKHGIVIMVSLFEGCGEGNLYEQARTWGRKYLGNNATLAVTSPSPEIFNNKAKWDGPKSFVTYFINTFGDDARLMAIETYNEPWGNRPALAKYLSEYAVSIQKSVPLTLGTAPADPCNIQYSVEAGMDMLHYHDNFPSSAEAFKKNAEGKINQGKLANLPVYCTEVQWVGGPSSINYPVYSNLAPTCNALMESGTWAPFYWTLMVHPCYLGSYRNSYKMYNGIINEDGSVNDLKNAEKIANKKLDVAENTENPYNNGSYSYRYMFSDSFFDLKAYKWTVKQGSFSASSGAYSGSGLTFANDTDFKNFKAVFDLCNGSGGIVFRAKDDKNYYSAEYDSAGKTLSIYKVASGKKELLASSSKLQGETESITLTLECQGESIRFYANCAEVKCTDSTYQSGLVGFTSSSSASFDNLKITT